MVGALLTGLGLVASGSLTRSAPVRALALATVAIAVLAVLLAVGSVLLRFTPALAPGNLAEVQAWYRRQFRRTYPVIAAGMLLLVAVGLAGAAGLLALTTDGTDEPELGVQLVGTGADATLTVHAAFPDLPPGRLLHVAVVGMGAADARTVLARAVRRSGGADRVSVTLTVSRLAGYRTVTVSATAARKRCLARIALDPSTDPPTVRCD